MGILTKQLEELSKLGYSRLFMHDVPPGVILKPGDWANYPSVDSGGFYSQKGFHIKPSGLDDGLYYLLPPLPEGKYFEKEIHNGLHSLDDIIDYIRSNHEVQS